MKLSESQTLAAQQLGEAIVSCLASILSELQFKPQVTEPPKAQPPKRQEEFQPMLVSSCVAAKLLGVSVRKLWSITAPRGPLRQIKIGASVRYTMHDLKAFIAQMQICADHPHQEQQGKLSHEHRTETSH